MPFTGELLGDRYRLDDRIAAGGMGEVWRATDTVLGRPVAVKTLLADYAGDAGFRTRFQHEARAMASLRHGGVAPVYDFGETADGAYLVMARVDGVPLNQWIAEHGPLTAEETMAIVARGARALAAAHAAGIVHRDVKPGNLIIEPDGNVVLVDFGVARSAQSVTLTGAREVVGTALYIAPEQVSKQATGPAADLYALGAVAYHCLAGRPPFLGDHPLAVAIQHLDQDPPPLPESVPAPVRELVTTAMAKKPAERFPSAIAMAEAAEAASASLHATPSTARAADGMSANGGAAAASALAATAAATNNASASLNATAADAPLAATASATDTANQQPTAKHDPATTADAPLAATASATDTANQQPTAKHDSAIAPAATDAAPPNGGASAPTPVRNAAAADAASAPTAGTAANDAFADQAPISNRDPAETAAAIPNDSAAVMHDAAGVMGAAYPAAAAGAGAAAVGNPVSRPAEARPLAETAVDHNAAVHSRGEAGTVRDAAGPGVVAGIAAPVVAAGSHSVSDAPARGLHDPVTGSRNNSPSRGRLAALSALLLALVGLGTALIIVNPFDGSGTPAPAASTPATEAPKNAPHRTTKAPKTKNNAVTSENSADDKETAGPSRTPRTTEPTTEEAEPTTTAPADETTTTTPTGEPEATTTAPEPDESGDEEVMNLR